ncbi:MAG: Toluene efflux pump outer membrane protein TtgI [Chlamydiae bacterium]|nr:Toluene efflux pump outer membrane protein TtgI [Chlamydiota bacterium]
MRRALFLLLLLAGCRPCLQPDLCLPDTFQQGWAVEMCMEDEAEIDLTTWWEQFEDPMLLGFIEEGISCNFDLRIARERIYESRAIEGIEFSRVLPQVDAIGNFRKMRNSETLSDSSFTGGTFVNIFRAGFDSFWEIDLFGKNLDRTQAATYEVLATEEEVRDVHVTIVGEVAVNYFTIRTLQSRIDIAKQHVGSQKELLSIVEERYDAGLIPELDVLLSRALLQARLAIIPALEARLYETIYRLAVLMGKVPELLASYFCESKPLPCYEGKIPLGLPSDLLCRRGDLRQAEFAMRASGARVLAARKEFFPTISLEGIYTYMTGFFTRWFQSQSRDWYCQPNITLPIFHGGEILSNIRVETSRQRQAVLNYEQSVLRALEEVEGALVGYFKEGARVQILQEEVNSYQEARDMAETLYLGGRVDFLFVLETEQKLFLSQNLLEESKEIMMTQLVAVYKSLGGGWECCELP